ncbi:MAG: hypothetical protein EOQ55_28620 [Mesorhizobium sp.]|uniref:hypothetical protein n=1 Tax=Mesorhizobium sp. TaxID=1871066 RepID=UPI000FE6D751|nr:hypothetical protein [Mesorhizobium sp.]RWG11360.1 MAG: hypothetical protein EOQ55_28620 [Mesorhizobium sp.]TIR22087.1 MAG: hypothetical protein E5X33_09030 [Mesorhizobium sp.]
MFFGAQRILAWSGGVEDRPTTEIPCEIYALPVAISAQDPGGDIRASHYWTRYGFVYAGSALPASMTAVTASTFLQNLVRQGDRDNPPPFEALAGLVFRLAQRFMQESRRYGMDGKFSAAFFGWSPYESDYKVAHIDGRDDGGFRVELSMPDQPIGNGEPWLVLGNGAGTFRSTLATYKASKDGAESRVPLRIVEKMVAGDTDPTVGGSASVAAAHEHGFEMFYSVRSGAAGQQASHRLFNGLDLDDEVGTVDQYFVAARGIGISHDYLLQGKVRA